MLTVPGSYNSLVIIYGQIKKTLFQTILGYYAYVQYFLFSLNIFKYLQFHAFVINSQVTESRQIVDFLGISRNSPLRFHVCLVGRLFRWASMIGWMFSRQSLRIYRRPHFDPCWLRERQLARNPQVAHLRPLGVMELPIALLVTPHLPNVGRAVNILF